MKFTKFYKKDYPKDLAYMLQNVEYDPAQFLSWYWYDVIRGGLPNVNEFTFELTSKSKKVVLLAQISMFFFTALGLLMLVFGGILVKILGFTIVMEASAITAVLLALLAYIVGRRAIAGADQKYVDNIRSKLGSHPATIIGVAGSYGKSTMRDTLMTVIAAGKKVATQPENFNTPAGTSRFVDTLDGDEEVLVIEMGEYQPGDVERLASVVKPDIGIITGINEQHMMRMGSKENAICTIYELADNVTDQSRVFVNAQSDWAMEGMREGNQTYSQTGVGGWKVSKFKTNLDGTKFSLKKDKDELSVESALLGAHQAGPLSVIAAVAMQVGLSAKQVEKGLSNTKQFKRRFELKPWSNGALVIDDTYNGNKAGFVVAIDFLNDLEIKGKCIYVTPGIIELGDSAEEVHRFIGERLAESKIEKIYLIRNRLTEIVEQSFRQAGGKADLSMIDNQQDFILNIPEYSTPSDLVYLQNSQKDHFFYN